MERIIYGQRVRGAVMDAETRCEHWHSELDIIAIKFKCCGEWFPCFECHSALAGHAASVWREDEREAKAILCGACGRQLSIKQYLNCDSTCPKCRSKFNPGCTTHYHLYFA